MSDFGLLEWAVLGSGWIPDRVRVVRKHKGVEGGWPWGLMTAMVGWERLRNISSEVGMDKGAFGTLGELRAFRALPWVSVSIRSVRLSVLTTVIIWLTIASELGCAASNTFR